MKKRLVPPKDIFKKMLDVYIDDKINKLKEEKLVKKKKVSLSFGDILNLSDKG